MENNKQEEQKPVVIVRAVSMEEMLNHLDDKLNYIIQLLAENKK